MRLALGLALLPTACAYCPNKCSGNGICNDDGSATCNCFTGRHGGDCSLLTCPSGRGWSDEATATDVAHNDVVCSNMGICDESTGKCTCHENFAGLACERMKCPNSCNAHGVCRSMKEYATTAEPGSFDSSAGPHTQGYHVYEDIWDASMIFGCDCDSEYTGFDCSLRKCPFGDDPLTTNSGANDDFTQLNEVVLFQCKATAGTFTLTFRGETTEDISVDATAEEIDAFIEALTTINFVTVEFALSNANACSNLVDQVVTITFTHDFGNVPDIYTQSAGSSSCESDDSVPSGFSYCGGTISFYYDGGSVEDEEENTHTSVAGSKENAYCSNRGNCDLESGQCTCFANYGSSDGYDAAGTRGDCGYQQTSVSACPGETSCNSKGTCDASTYKCSCQSGFKGGSCELQECPRGRAWFDLPSADNKAHAKAECSNMGICDETTGECTCHIGFHGSACQYKTCPPSADNPCSGHGTCYAMQYLAELSEDNGDATSFTYGRVPNDPGRWDYQSIMGCKCDPGYEGYDCSLYVCPTGDDPDTDAHSTGVTNVHEVQLFKCTADSGSFTMTFRQQTTDAISYDATAEAVKAALLTLESIDDITVQFSSSTNKVCSDVEGDNIVSLTFTQQLGNVPDTTFSITLLGHSSVNPDYPSILAAFDGTSLEDSGAVAHPSYMGTMENAECSNRGICSRSDGQCNCFTGFASSNGNSEGGTRGDCGWKLPYDLSAADS